MNLKGRKNDALWCIEHRSFFLSDSFSFIPAVAASKAQNSESNNMPCKCKRKQSETNFLSAITAPIFQSNAALFADTTTAIPPTNNKTLHYCAVPAKDARAATPTQFVYFRSQDNKNA